MKRWGDEKTEILVNQYEAQNVSEALDGQEQITKEPINPFQTNPGFYVSAVQVL